MNKAQIEPFPNVKDKACAKMLLESCWKICQIFFLKRNKFWLHSNGQTNAFNADELEWFQAKSLIPTYLLSNIDFLLNNLSYILHLDAVDNKLEPCMKLM